MKKMNSRRLDAFVREFGFLKQMSGLDGVGKIKVARCDAAVLLETGTVVRARTGWEINKVFHVVSGEQVIRLKPRVEDDQFTEGAWSNVDEANPIGEQIADLNVIPDFIVLCDDHGGNWETWTIYKMDKFNLKLWCEVHMRMMMIELEDELEVPPWKRDPYQW